MKRIAELLSRDDIFIQYGGEEFLFLIYKKRVSIIEFKIKMDEIRVLVENLNIRVKGETAEAYNLDWRLYTDKFSYISTRCIQKADSALYKSKHSGR